MIINYLDTYVPESLFMNSSNECEVLKSGREEQTSTLLPSPPSTTPLSLILDSDTEWLMVTVDASGNRFNTVEIFGFASDNCLPT